MNIREIVEAFLEQGRLERRYAEHSLRGYRHDLQEFLDYLEGQGVHDVGGLTVTLIRGFLSGLLQKNKKTSVGRKVASIRSCFKYAQRKGWIEENPTLHLRAPKTEKHLPPFLSEKEAEHLLRPSLEPSWLQKRDQAAFELFYASGIRLSELAGLNWEEIDFSLRMIRVRGKGGRERVVPLGRVAVEALREYRGAQEEAERGAPGLKVEDRQAVFLNRRGRRMTDRTIARRLKQRVLLGHRSLSTTQKYTHISLGRLMEVYKKSFPRS